MSVDGKKHSVWKWLLWGVGALFGVVVLGVALVATVGYQRKASKTYSSVKVSWKLPVSPVVLAKTRLLPQLLRLLTDGMLLRWLGAIHVTKRV